MANFDSYLPTLLRFEGGWADDPADAGGATMKGVTLATFRAYYGQGKTKADLRNITDDQLRHIYKTGYWDKCKADLIASQNIAEMIVDWAVNSGPATAARKVQAVLGVQADGVIGTQTLAAINRSVEVMLQVRLAAARLTFYADIVTNKPSQLKFLKGWRNRALYFAGL